MRTNHVHEVQEHDHLRQDHAPARQQFSQVVAHLLAICPAYSSFRQDRAPAYLLIMVRDRQPSAHDTDFQKRKQEHMMRSSHKRREVVHGWIQEYSVCRLYP